MNKADNQSNIVPENTKPVQIVSETQPAVQKEHLVKPLTNQGGKQSMKKNLLIGLVSLVVILAGIGTGYALSLNKNSGGGFKNTNLKREVKNEEITKGTLVGVPDEKTFRDNAEGKLEKGGVNGEGSHHLTRPGGESQNVYLTSSIVDLSQFEGREVKVWGETFSAQKAGWLMDVGRLEVLE